MFESRLSRLVLWLALAAGALLGGCVVVPAAGPYRAAGPVMVAPPPSQGEVFGVAPGPGYFWISGYWNWVGARHVWIAGRWEPGRPGQHWVPHHWQRDGAGWRASPGHWRGR